MARTPAIETETALWLTLDLKKKMEEYIANGARLGWLLDPVDNCAYIYTPQQEPQRIDAPAAISAGPVLPGFNFNFKEIL
jgi:Uma2 family endonuclease